MTWGKIGKRGWGSAKEEKEEGWLRQVIHTIVEVVTGGVIRAGKTAYLDDVHVGFWLGIDGDAKARFNLGDADQFLKWTGTRLSVRGDLTLQALLGKLAGGGVVWEDDSNVAVMRIGPQVDLGAITALVIEGLNGSDLEITSEGGITLDPVSGAVSVRYNRIVNVADATADGDAVSRSFGDGRYLTTTTGDARYWTQTAADARYLQQSAGWSGMITVGTKSITVVNGQITAYV